MCFTESVVISCWFNWVSSTTDMLRAHSRMTTSCWVLINLFTASIACNERILCFLCSIGAASFFHNHAPEPLPAVYRCVHPASCVRVCQGTSLQLWTYLKFLKACKLTIAGKALIMFCSQKYCVHAIQMCNIMCGFLLIKSKQFCFLCSINTIFHW